MDDILDNAKITSGTLAPEPVTLADLMRRTLGPHRAAASAKGVVLESTIDAALAPAYRADPLRVTQVLGNLVSNAVKFTSAGSVRVSAERAGGGDGVETVRFTVTDTGIGIDRDEQRQLFARFAQVGDDTSGLYGGTGRGLAISRQLVEMMGGEIGVESLPGKGTSMRVSLTFPVCAAPPEDAPSGARTRPGFVIPAALSALLESGERPRVLAADDHESNLHLLERQLQMMGVDVRTATNGREALALWQAERFSVVITDCNMPEMDGYALARAIRAEEADGGRGRTPIIALTANALPSAVGECRDAGMDDILVKPVRLAQLGDRLTSWLAAPGPAADAHDIAPDPRDVPVLDLSELTLVTQDPGELAQILRDFVSATRRDLASLATALDQNDTLAAARLAHRIKGAGLMVGAQGMADAAARTEATLRKGGARYAEVSVAPLDHELGRLAAKVEDVVGTGEPHA